MTSRPADRVALVTGAAKRVGRVIALDLARQGYAVGVHHRSSAAEAAAVVAEITSQGGRATALDADLTQPDAAGLLVAACARELGPVTCLVNNASLLLYDDIERLTAEVWQQNLGVNLAAPVFLAQAFARQLPAAATGAIVNLIDQRVWRPVPDFLSYGIAKGGLWSATRMLAQALAPRIRVNAIGPGPALQSIYQTTEDFARQWTSPPLERGTTPEEIAAAVLFILSAPAMTGQMIALDGGQHLDWRHDDEASPETRATTPAPSAPSSRPRRVDATQPADGIRHIFVRELEIDTVIGVLPHEKLAPQRIYVSLDIAAEETGEPGSDRLADVVDYDAIVATARTLAEAGHVNLLETLAERIAAATLPLDPRIITVRVSIAKPDIYGDARSVGIEIERAARRS